jgi:uncharacterized GH25 family protein
MKKALLGLALLIAPLGAADLTKLTISVTNERGKPVDQASVIVKFVQGRSKMKFGAKIRTEWETKTSQEGIVKIPSIPQGKILIQVIAKNYQTYGETIDVQEEEKTIDIKLKPPQAQYTAHPQ